MMNFGIASYCLGRVFYFIMIATSCVKIINTCSFEDYLETIFELKFKLITAGTVSKWYTDESKFNKKITMLF